MSLPASSILCECIETAKRKNKLLSCNSCSSVVTCAVTLPILLHHLKCLILAVLKEQSRKRDFFSWHFYVMAFGLGEGEDINPKSLVVEWLWAPSEPVDLTTQMTTCSSRKAVHTLFLGVRAF